jgi:hypothetical protein
MNGSNDSGRKVRRPFWRRNSMLLIKVVFLKTKKLQECVFIRDKLKIFLILINIVF